MYVRVAGLPSIVIAVREIVSEESWNRTRKKRERKWIRRTEQTHQSRGRLAHCPVRSPGVAVINGNR